MQRSVSFTAAALLLAVTSGCMSADSSTGTTEATSNPSSDSAAEQHSNSSDLSYAFGETYNTDDAPIVTTVSTPETITTSQYAQPGSAPAWAVDITFHNSTDRTFNPIALQLTATSGDKAVQEVFDSSQGYQGFFAQTARMAPGSTLEVTVAYTGEADAPKTLEIASMSGGNTVTWTTQQ